MMSDISVITIDGVSGSGKGTIAQLLAHKLGWHYLDSGAIYRSLGYLAYKEGVELDDEQALADLATSMLITQEINEKGDLCKVFVNNQDVSCKIRAEKAGTAASKVSAFAKVREQVNIIKRSFRQEPGLITDGRDMGSIVFPDAAVKFYLDASASERAKRRHKQLQNRGIDVKFSDLLHELEARDARDKQRNVAPLVVPENAIVIDTSLMSIDEVLETVVAIVRKELAI